MDDLDPRNALERVRRLKRELAEIERAYGIDHGEDDEPKWQEFLTEHPELTERPRLEITDDGVYAALVEIHESHPMETHNFPCASGVKRLLDQRQGLDHLWGTELGKEWSHSELMRVVAALKRLEKTGRVRQEFEYVYGQRSSSDWHPVGDDA